MPLYDFKCPNCGHEDEKVVDRNTEIYPCSECTEYMLRVAVQRPGFRTDHTWDI